MGISEKSVIAHSVFDSPRRSKDVQTSEKYA